MNSHDDASLIERLDLEIPGRFSDLSVIRRHITDKSLQAGMSEDQSALLEMAVDEAVTNVIEHSLGGDEAPASDPGGRLRLRIHVLHFKDRIEIEIVDNGPGFDFERHPEVAPDQWLGEERERGLGMYIINHFVDRISYRRGEHGGNCLRLTKHL